MIGKNRPRDHDGMVRNQDVFDQVTGAGVLRSASGYSQQGCVLASYRIEMQGGIIQHVIQDALRANPQHRLNVSDVLA
jgi:hypothetical protein